jgi:uncharacterized C2H2 Zn-finger protein
MTGGIIYMVQPAELVGTSRYKIGCSEKKTLDRCRNGYKKGTRYIVIMECVEPFKIERKIKETFNKKFKLVAGKEYFEGDENEMKKEFLIITENCNMINNDVPKEQKINNNMHHFAKSNLEQIYYCRHCDFYTKTIPNMKQHLTSKKHKKLSNGDICFGNYDALSYRCLLCDKLFNTKSNVTRHINSVHTIKKENIDNENKNVKTNDTNIIDKRYNGMDNMIKFAMKFEDKKDGFDMIKTYINDIMKLEDKMDVKMVNAYEEIKQIYKEENEYYKKSANNVGNITSAFSYAVKNYIDAPKFETLESETAKKLLCRKIIDENVITLDNDKTAEYIIKLFEQDMLCQHLGKILTEHYKTINPKDRSIWTTDASRMKMIVKMSDGWVRDSNGNIVNEQMILPLLNEMIKIIDQYNTSNGSNIEETKILDIKTDISSEKINKDILKYLIPEFIMKYKLL